MKANTIVCAVLALVSTSVFALADEGHGASIGEPGDPSKVNRVIEVSMDEMKFVPDRIAVKEGETIKFVITNDGRLVHEFNLGTMEMWKGHNKEMRTMLKKGMMSMTKLHHDKMMKAGMMHDDPNSVLLAPGETADVIWNFSEAVTLGYACNVPGHLEAGMVGEVTFEGQ